MENKKENIINKFSSIKWLENFRIASNIRQGFRELRAEIFQQTVEIIKNGGYQKNDVWITIDSELEQAHTKFYDNPGKLKEQIEIFETKFSVIEADCLETAILTKNAGLNPCVLNMANRQNPGGGVVNGAGAQEENIFRRTNLLVSLYQFVDYSNQYNIERNDEHSYPLNREKGGIYSKGITVFRTSESSGYDFMATPIKMDFVSVPAINRPELKYINGQYRIIESLVEPTKEKIRSIFRIAGLNNNDCLILGAFGCGAFRNPPEHMAELFKEVINEKEFKNYFRLIVFSIIEDHNSKKPHNPEGNLIPFIRVFDQK